MGLFDFLRTNRKEVAPKLEQRNKNIYSVGVAGNVLGGQSHKLIEILSDCKDYYTMTEESRRNATDILLTALPHYMDAINKISNFVGCAYPVAESDALERRLRDFAEWEATTYFEKSKKRPIYQGVEGLVKTDIKTTVRYGMSFIQDIFEDEMYKGILLHNPNRFSNHSFDGVTEELVYRPIQGGIYIINENSPYFDSMGYNFYPDSMWGLTLADGGRFFAERLLRIIVARSNAWIWRGNPIMIDTISVDRETAGIFEKEQWDEFNTKVSKMFTKSSNAIKQQDKGKRSYISQTLPGMFSRETKAFGEGINPMTGFVEDANWLIRPLASLTGIPPELLGLFTGGEGFSGEKFRTLYRITKPMIATLRANEKSRLKSRSDTWLESIGERGNFRARNAYKWQFEDQDFLGPKEKAEAQRTTAEAFEKAVNTSINLVSQLDMFPGGKDPEQIVIEMFREMGLGFVVEDM